MSEMVVDYGRERVVIESSILASTLLFVVAGIKGTTENAISLGEISIAGLCFIGAAISATSLVFLELDPRNSRLSYLEFALFAGALGGVGYVLAELAWTSLGIVGLIGELMALLVACAIVAMILAILIIRRRLVVR
jgi:hypothetical protein